MAASAKYAEIAQILQQQIKEKAYALNELPSERKLAAQLGVSYMTARKAVQSLVKDGVLERSLNGRVEICMPKSRAHASRTIGFLAPAQMSTWSAQSSWLRDLSQVLEQRHGVLRPIAYVGDSDPIIFDALDGDFDGLFVILPRQVSPLLADRLQRMRGQLVVLWQDATHLGIPSIETGPAQFVSKLLDHLAGLGHQRIDCFNAQSLDWTARQRVAHWQVGLERRGLSGKLHDFTPRGSTTPAAAARLHVAGLLERGELDATALLCVNTSLAWGAVRACQDRGLRIGKDISICGFGEIEIAELLNPSVTSIRPADRASFLKMGLEWIESKGTNWHRPLRLEPDDVELFVGESTGPAPTGGQPGSAAKERLS
jgi:DNA-binding LacI/PurR family transcriptional regulator